MKHIIFYPYDSLYETIIEYLYDEYPDKIDNVVYNNERSLSRYEYRFRRFEDKRVIKSILPHTCDFSFSKCINDIPVDFTCKLEILIYDRYIDFK